MTISQLKQRMAQNLTPKKKVWLYVLCALTVLIVAAIIVCAIALPDVFRQNSTKIKERDIANEVAKNMSNVIVPLVIAILLFVAAILTLLFKNSASESSRLKYFTTKRITYLAIFTALSYVFYMFAKFNLPFFPFFLDFQISDMPALICGFMMGPVSGVIVIVLKVALKLPFSSTLLVGELGDLILGIAFVLPASIIYKYNRTKKGAVLGLVCGGVICIAASLLVNRFILIPFYTQGGDVGKLVAPLSGLYKNLTVDNFYAYYLGLGVLPFNILRCLLSGLVTFFIYKRCEKLFLKLFGDVRPSRRAQNGQEVLIKHEEV